MTWQRALSHVMIFPDMSDWFVTSHKSLSSVRAVSQILKFCSKIFENHFLYCTSTLSVFFDMSYDPIEFRLRVRDQRRGIFAKTALYSIWRYLYIVAVIATGFRGGLFRRN